MAHCGAAERRTRRPELAVALGVFAVWTIATCLLEGRIETLLRPEAALDGANYAIIANLLIGIVGAIAVLWFLIGRRSVDKPAAGFGRPGPSAVRTMLGLTLGLAVYMLQGAPSLNPIVLMNVFSQVLVVSAAEVVVCWAVVGAAVESVLKAHGRAVSVIGAALVTSTLFGLYHFAHSAPLNTPGMVALLSIVGLLTSAFFLIVRDIYATIVFHNFLGVWGNAGSRRIWSAWHVYGLATAAPDHGCGYRRSSWAVRPNAPSRNPIEKLTF